MKSQERTFWEILSVVAVLVIVVFYLLSVIQNIQSERKVEALLQPGPIPKLRRYDPIENAERIRHARALYAIWQARHERDMAAEVAPFLRDTHGNVRGSAVRVLARLGTPAAERVLAETAAERRQYSGGLSREWSMALGRAQARELKGWAKVNTVAHSAGLSFDEVTLLSEKINEKMKSTIWGTEGYAIMVEMIDLLATMGKQGENIAPFVDQLTLNSAQQVQLKAATLPEAQGTQMILDYIAGLDVISGDVDPLTRSLLYEVNSTTTELLVQKLQLIHQSEGKTMHIGYREIVRIAEKTGDARVSAALRRFGQSADSEVNGYSMQLHKVMETPMWYPPLP